MLNRVDLIGRVGADPEINATRDGKKVANVRLATSESWKDSSGQKQERTEWHRVVVFNDATAGFIEQYVKKGDLIHVTGQLQTRKWQDRDGAEKYTTEVVVRSWAHSVNFLANPRGGNYPPNATSEDDFGGGRPRAEQPPAFDGGGQDDDIPF